MTLREIHQHYLNSLLKIYNKGESVKITEMVLESIGGISKKDLIINGSQKAETHILSELETALHRLMLHEPVQYITGEAWFSGQSFAVNPFVLIPRPETEELLLLAKNICIAHDYKNILDIGTGSGCIAISLKNQLPSISMEAIDISEDALKTAKFNALNLRADICFHELNFLESFAWCALKKYDLIISNPPYIPQSEKAEMDKNVTAHEPHLALFVTDSEPLIFYETIVNFADEHLNTNGTMLMEIHELLGQEVIDLFARKGYETKLIKDMMGKDRIVEAFTRLR